MWTRQLSSNMGIDQSEFIKAFVLALSEETVINKLDSAICGKLHMEVGNLTDVHNKFQQDVSQFREINTQLQMEVSSLRRIVQDKDSKITSLEARVAELEIKLDDQEQYSRRNSLRISGITESDNEVIGPKVLEFINTRLNLDSNVTNDQIDRMHRVGKPQPNKSRPVLVKFATYQIRKKVYSNRSKLKPRSVTVQSNTGTPQRPDDGTSLNASDGEPQEPLFFINEDLTKTRATLLWRARSLKKQSKIKDCWSADGNILIRNNQGKIQAVRSMVDLNNIAV